MACPGPAGQRESSSGRCLRDSPVPHVYSVETRICPAKDGIAVSLCLVDNSSQSTMDPEGPRMPVGWVSPNTWDSRSQSCFQGQYLDHVDITKEQEVLAGSRTQPITPVLKPHGATAGSSHHGHRTCGRTVRFAEQPCTPCMRRKHSQGSEGQQCRYKDLYREAQYSPVTVEKSPQEPAASGKSMMANSDTLHRPGLERSGQSLHAQTVATNCTEDNQNVTERCPTISQDSMDSSERANNRLGPHVVGTSEKCHVVIQGQPSEGSRDSYLEMLPRLHVVPGKKTTTFGLVSPKLNRRRTKPKHEDDPQDPKTFSPFANGSWSDGPKPLKTHSADMEKVAPTRPPSAGSKPETSLLQLGVACLTGGRDRSGRSVVEVYGDHTHWGSPLVSSLELSSLLLYFDTITRKDRYVGLTVVYDARNVPPHPKFTEALQIVQEQDSQAVHCVLLLQCKEKAYSHEKDSAWMDTVISVKGLHKYVECNQLTSALAGPFAYNHRAWLDLHRELYPFVLDLKVATNLLLEAIRKLEGVHKIDTVQDVEQCISDQRALMKDVLEDSRLVALQREGGAMLARLRWECDIRTSHCREMCEVMDTVETLYNQVEEQVHVLARRSNVSLQHLNLLLQLREMESRFTEIKEWFGVEGHRQLLEAESVKISSVRIQETLQSFSTFLSEANEQKLKAMTLLTEAERIQVPNFPETEGFQTMVSTFKSSLSDFLSQAEQCCDDLRGMVNVCHFCERATEVAEVCSQLLDEDHLYGMAHEEKWATLQQCHQKLSEFSPERFQDTKTLASSLQISRGIQVWNMAWLRCQEVSRQLEESLQHLEQAQRDSVPLTYEWHGDGGEESTVEAATNGPHACPQSDTRHPPEHYRVNHSRDRDSVHGTVTCFNFRQSRKGRKGSRTVAAVDSGLPEHGKNTPKKTSDCRQKVIEGSGTAGCQWFPWKNTSNRYRAENSASSSFKIIPSNYTGPNRPAPSSYYDVQVVEAAYSDTQITLPCSGTQDSVLICSKTQTTIPTCSRTNTPVPTCSETQEPCQIQARERPLQAAHNYRSSEPGRIHSEEARCQVELLGSTSHSKETVSRGSDGRKTLNVSGTTNTMKLWCILEELLVTELEYVRSLGYVLTHYLPLLARPDVPQDLRGQRGRIFGSLEKLHSFHCHYFLQELEACRVEPLRVGRCFLRHRESFGLYALYSKNKPQSDALIQHHKYFKRKQLELGDSMDLSSYLLKPVQRISKYSLLLQEMLEECGPDHSLERQEIQAAAEVVRFQLRHGNDLLTMDAIQDCELNLKEQGQLMRQDEFHVTFRKKRTLRRVFLFQELLLFTKAKKTLRGDDVYVYKQSFKTSDIGLTRSCGDSGLCFEIWFRRRRAQHTYVLQAERRDVKQAWTFDLEHILWKQALKNRELWRQERVFMGVGNKPFMDQTSEATIHDKSVSCLLPGRECEELLKMPNLVVSSFQSERAPPRPESDGSGSCVSISGSHSSSSSGRGSLSPRGFHGTHVHGSHGICLPQETLSGDDYQKQSRTADCKGSLGESACVCGGSAPFSAPGECPAGLAGRFVILSPAVDAQPSPVCLPQCRPPVLARNKLTRGCDLQTVTHISQSDREQV
ncbi:puratrophin-1 [Brachyhypopomus gauderio]|uniref:puratrophin-1 n=1 Tax=Brachyhypopomus gauderio TaxID=698409 RepID=UPI0040430932